MKKKKKISGGQPEHLGHSLQPVEQSDEVITHQPGHCEACQHELGEIVGQIRERRQIHEIPDFRHRVIKHRVEAIGYPVYQYVTYIIYASLKRISRT